MALSALAKKNGWPRGAGLYQNMKNPFFNQKMFELRISSEKPGFVVIAPGIDLGPRDSIFVPFLISQLAPLHPFPPSQIE